MESVAGFVIVICFDSAFQGWRLLEESSNKRESNDYTDKSYKE